jgi:hypothetical protein
MTSIGIERVRLTERVEGKGEKNGSNRLVNMGTPEREGISTLRLALKLTTPNSRKQMGPWGAYMTALMPSSANPLAS